MPRSWPTGMSSSRATRLSGTTSGIGSPLARNRRSATRSSDCETGRAMAAAFEAARDDTPMLRATPFGSRIMITEPSPRMVLPLNMVTCRRIGATGLTTISSVSKTSSTTIPSRPLPAAVTTTVVFCGFSCACVHAQPARSAQSAAAGDRADAARAPRRYGRSTLRCRMARRHDPARCAPVPSR